MSRAYTYDVVKEVQLRIENMGACRVGHAMVFVKQNVYVFGGFDGKALLRSCESYSLSTKSWTPLTDLPIKCGTFAVAHANEIWISGKKQISAYDYSANSHRIINVELAHL